MVSFLSTGTRALAASSALTSSSPQRSALKGGREGAANGVNQLFNYDNPVATPNWSLGESSHGTDTSRSLSTLGTTSSLSNASNGFTSNSFAESSAGESSDAYNQWLSDSNASAIQISSSPSSAVSTVASNTGSALSASQGSQASASTGADTALSSSAPSSSWCSTLPSWLSGTGDSGTGNTASTGVTSITHHTATSTAGKDPSSRYTWTTSPSTGESIRVLADDDRQGRGERKTHAARGVLRSKGASTTIPSRSAESTKLYSESLYIQSRLKEEGNPNRKAWLKSLNDTWRETYSQTSGKSTRLSFAQSSADDRNVTRDWRAERYLDSAIGRRVEAKSIGEYQTRTLTDAARDARKAGMDSTEAEAHLRETLQSLSQTTYMTETEVLKEYPRRELYQSTGVAQSHYYTGIKSTDADGQNPNYRSFLDFMRATDTMMGESVVQVRKRNHREAIDWSSKAATQAALRKYMDVYARRTTKQRDVVSSRSTVSKASSRKLRDRRRPRRL